MWVSAVINPYGTPARVVQAVISGQVIAVVTQHLLDELAAVLIRPKFRRWVTVADALALVESLAGTADLRPDPGPSPQRVRDPDDDYLVALGAGAGAVIVTEDADLLDADLDPTGGHSSHPARHPRWVSGRGLREIADPVAVGGRDAACASTAHIVADLYIVGGAVMDTEYDAREATADVDAVDYRPHGAVDRAPQLLPARWTCRGPG